MEEWGKLERIAGSDAPLRVTTTKKGGLSGGQTAIAMLRCAAKCERHLHRLFLCTAPTVNHKHGLLSISQLHPLTIADLVACPIKPGWPRSTEDILSDDTRPCESPLMGSYLCHIDVANWYTFLSLIWLLCPSEAASHLVYTAKKISY